MSASVSLIPTTTSNSLSSPAAPQTLTSGLSILGSGAGLFGHILSLGNTELLATDAPQSAFQLTGTAVGNNGVGLDSSMLTLSQELSSLSAEDLQALIDKSMLSDGKGEGIDIETLKSLTKGIPSLDGVANENVDSNSLLSATNITPATLSDLKSLLNAIKNTSGTELDIDALKEVEDKSDIDLSSATSNELIMVFFVPAQIENRNSDITDFEFDPSIFSSLTKSVQPKASEPSLFDNGIDLYSGTESSLSFSGEDGEKLDFQGSLSSLGGKKAKDESNSLNVNGQLSMSTADKAMSFFTTPLSHFAESSLLSTETNSVGLHNLSANTNPLFISSSVTGSHPATLFIAKIIEKASGSDKAKQELSVQLDPPELGRMQIHLSMEKGETMKVRLVAETQETLTLLQRDSHALKSALHNAGIQTDSSSLSFDLSSGNQSFNELLGGSQQDNQSSRNAHFVRNADGSIISEDQIQLTETKMNFIPDVSTGNIHYSLLV